MRPRPHALLPVAFASFAGLGAGGAAAVPAAAPPPGRVAAADVTMAIVNKRQSGSFTLRWTPAIDASGHARQAYDVLVSDCADVRSASGGPLPLAAGGRLHAVSGPPYALALAGCTCNASAAVHTAAVPPETARSAPAVVARGTIFGPPCR